MPKFFRGYSFCLPLPSPFDSYKSTSKTHTSMHYEKGVNRSTLHPWSLNAIIKYIDLNNGHTDGAIGHDEECYYAEYVKNEKETEIVRYFKNSGMFEAMLFNKDEGIFKDYELDNHHDTGAGLVFVLMPILMEDPEFRKHYNLLALNKSFGYQDSDKSRESALILCDNIYRRIEGIRKNPYIDDSIQPFIPSDIYKTHCLTDILGEFSYIKINKPNLTILIPNSDFVSKYKIADREFSDDEKALIPQIEDWYIIPEEIDFLCKHAKASSEMNTPMRNFMLRGQAGTGKTEGAKAVAAGLCLPYVNFNCSPEMEGIDLVGDYQPNSSSNKDDALFELINNLINQPEKIQSAFQDNKIMFSLLLSVLERQQGQKLIYNESPLVKAVKNGYVCEIQEPSIISNQGVLTKLNSLLDRCNSLLLPTGEIIKRHPDCILILTTNNDYEGCKKMNQSVISRMNMVFDINLPSLNIIVNRVSAITKCDKKMVSVMAKIMFEMAEYLRENYITDGSCGMRELINWVQSYQIENDIVKAAQNTILSSATTDRDEQEKLKNICLLTHVAAA